MPSWKGWVQRPSGPIKSGGSASTFRREYLGSGRECLVRANINNRSKSLHDKLLV
jgi:hypothetical protein